jgi:hypothetical protein
MTAALAGGYGRAGARLAVTALWLLHAVACEGTKSALFAPLAPQSKVIPPKATTPDAGGHHVQMMMDAGRSMLPPPAPPPAEDDAGSVRDPDLDANVTFIWTETLPGQGTCRAGVYSGSFECDSTDALGIPFSLSGQIAFTLSGSSEQQHLMISDGSISGALLLSGLDGQLDCIQNHFQATSTEGHSLSIGDPNSPFALTFPTFNASLQGEYDKQALVISGTFSMVNDSGAMCTGTFRVSAAP